MKTRHAYVLAMALAASPAYAQPDALEAKAMQDAVKAAADAQKELAKYPKIDAALIEQAKAAADQAKFAFDGVKIDAAFVEQAKAMAEQGRMMAAEGKLIAERFAFDFDSARTAAAIARPSCGSASGNARTKCIRKAGPPPPNPATTAR